MAANLDHPNIVTIYEVSQVEGVYFIAMRFLAGRTLSQILEAEGPLPVSQVQAIIEQISSVLNYAHARGFIHRDIKFQTMVEMMEALRKAVAEPEVASPPLVELVTAMSPENADRVTQLARWGRDK